MYTDDNGIVRFEGSDNIAPLHTALNTALESVSTAGVISDGTGFLRVGETGNEPRIRG